MTSDREVVVVLPEGVDDPGRPSGGNVYDRRACECLAAAGWTVREIVVPGSWPWPADDEVAVLSAVLADLPAGSVVLIDGLVASAAPGALLPQAARLEIVVVVHQLVADAAKAEAGAGAHAHRAHSAAAREAAALSAATAVITTSAWSRGRVLAAYGLDPARVHVAEPGVDPAPLAARSAAGGSFLCVGVVAPHKGQDVLVEALAAIADEAWRCTVVGGLERDRTFAERTAQRADAFGIGPRVSFVGAQTGAALASAFASADLLVLPSRGETYGMAVAEGLARGIPVVASEVGGVPATLGFAADGVRPGLLVPPDDPAALAAALRRWLGDPRQRDQLRAAAVGRRGDLAGWERTVERIGDVLRNVRAAA